MGSFLSYFYYGKNEPDPVTGLTPKEICLIKSSWALCKKDLTGVGIQLFLIFFKDFPEYQNYFPFKNEKYENLVNNKQLKAHGTSVAYGFSSVVDNVDNIDILIPILHKIADSHSKRNISEKAFNDLKISLMKLLKQSLQAKLTRECEKAWQKALDVAFKVILDQLMEFSK